MQREAALVEQADQVVVLAHDARHHIVLCQVARIAQPRVRLGLHMPCGINTENCFVVWIGSVRCSARQPLLSRPSRQLSLRMMRDTTLCSVRSRALHSRLCTWAQCKACKFSP